MSYYLLLGLAQGWKITILTIAIILICIIVFSITTLLLIKKKNNNAKRHNKEINAFTAQQINNKNLQNIIDEELVKTNEYNKNIQSNKNDNSTTIVFHK